MGVAGASVFYGRGQEDAMLQNTLRSNSAALIGGRRIGKTSLLQHARSRLLDAGFNVQYADCQAIDSWATLAQHAAQHWQADVDLEFSASAVDELIAQLQTGHEGQLVVMLDEVDNLLRWDRNLDLHGMTEPLFRSFRSLSQEGSCQFVFSGERLIAQVLWDPGSPHWNFCRAIPVRQLAKSDAKSLFSNPVVALGVRIVDPEESDEEVWRATSGHPQIVQQLGELVVSALNDRPSDQRLTIASTDIRAIASSPEFQRHYVRTYWGQATTRRSSSPVWSRREALRWMTSSKLFMNSACPCRLMAFRLAFRCSTSTASSTFQGLGSSGGLPTSPRGWKPWEVRSSSSMTASALSLRRACRLS